MPEINRYESRIGPQRYEVPVKRATDYAGQAWNLVSQIGKALFGIGAGLEEYQKRVIDSHAEVEFGAAQNQANQALHDFELERGTDPEYLKYGEKWEMASGDIRETVIESLTTEQAKKGFNIWFDDVAEQQRFKVLQLAQKRELEWQGKTVEDTVAGIVARGDEYAVADVKSYLEGVKNRGLITNDNYLAALEQAKSGIAWNQAWKQAVILGEADGIPGVLNAKNTPGLTQKERMAMAKDLKTYFSYLSKQEKEQEEELRRGEFIEVLDLHNRGDLTWNTLKGYENLTEGDLKSFYSMLSEGEWETDPGALGDVVSALMEGEDFYVFEDFIKEQMGNKKLSPTDTLKYWKEGKKGLAPDELKIAVSTVDGFFDSFIRQETSASERVKLYEARGRVLNQLNDAYFDRQLSEDQLIDYAKQLLRPYTDNLFKQVGRIFTGEKEPIVPGPGKKAPAPEATDKQPPKKHQKYGVYEKTNNSGVHFYRKDGVWYRTKDFKSWQRYDTESGLWQTE